MTVSDFSTQFSIYVHKHMQSRILSLGSLWCIAKLNEGIELIVQHQKRLILITDKSKYGWKTFGEYQDNELPNNDQDAKKMKKAEWIRSNEGLTLEMSAFESLYGGQFTLSTQLIKPNYLVILPTDAAPHFL